MSLRTPELLLPAGNAEMAMAAIHNGADAIYVGFPGFNARGRAAELSIEELRRIIETCHLHGVRVNLAFNVVIFENELEQVVPLLEQVLPLSPDALIVQDLGLATLIRKMAPEQAIHASTQMTVTSAEAIALLEDLDIRRFVLGRENSLKEIELISQSLGEKPRRELEVFVHGALCVSYSGQCFTSESIGGRSANRGQCAQSCRFGYELIVDGETRQLPDDKRYLVSPQDLCGIEEVPKLMDLGVRCFKVEGRLKSPEYVAAAAQEYRRAIDRHAEGRALDAGEAGMARDRMATTFSRGFFTGWLHGVDHQRLVDGQPGSHRGRRIGDVLSIEGPSMIARLDSPRPVLQPGDSLYWVRPGADEGSGAQIYQALPIGDGQLEIRFGSDVRLEPGIAGAQLYLSHQASQKRELRKSFQDRSQRKRVPVDVELQARLGQPLHVTLTDGTHRCEAATEALVQAAKSRAVDEAFFRDELSALGGTAFELRGFSAQVDPGVFFPHAALKGARQALTAELEKLRAGARPRRIAPASEVLDWLGSRAEERVAREPSKLTLVLRNREQVTDFIAAGLAPVHAVILDFEFGMDYEPSLAALRAAGIRSGIATTRVFKPKETTHFTRIERLKPDVVLVRNLGALHHLTQVRPIGAELRGDFSLNVTNHLTASYLLSKGLGSVTASYDLNARQVADLLEATDPSRVEVTVHQYMPSFHMEHCVFAAFLSQGSSFRDCGKPCEKHRVELKDQFGNRHHIKPDPECRNTMYNAHAQSAARYIGEWKELGLGFVRFEALHERGEELAGKIRAYQELLAEARPAEEILRGLTTHEKYGLGEGTHANPHAYRSRKKVTRA